MVFGLLNVPQFQAVSQGKTKDEAIENIKDAIKVCLELRAEKGLPLTVETRQVEVAAA